jgi:hypothetical protein
MRLQHTPFLRHKQSFFRPERSAVVRHHFAGPFSLTRVAMGRRSREFLDSVQGVPAQRRRLACDACLAQPFDVGHSSIEGLNKLPQRTHDELTICHRHPLIHVNLLRSAASQRVSGAD